MVDSMSSPLDLTLSSESVNNEVVPLTQSPSCPCLLVESELKPAEVFVVSLDCSTQVEILFFSTESSPSTVVISFYWSDLIESCIPSIVPFHISM